MIKLEHKIVVKRTPWADDHPQGEIKLSNPAGQTQALIIVAKDGWNYKPYDCRKGKPGTGWDAGRGKSTGMQVRISMNGPLMLTKREWREIYEYIDHVYLKVLEEHDIRGI